MFGKKQDKRFAVLYEESIGLATSCTVLVDKTTGVNYLLTAHGSGAGLTPLLNADGQVIISTHDELDELQYK